MPVKIPVMFLEGRKCIYCGAWKPYRLADRRVKCKTCRRYYSLKKLKNDLSILFYFALELSANRTAKELGLSYKTIRNKYMFFREKISKHLEDNFQKLSGELEIDENYFGGKRKGKRGRGAFNKVVVLGILERNGRVYTKVVPNVKAETLMQQN